MTRSDMVIQIKAALVNGQMATMTDDQVAVCYRAIFGAPDTRVEEDPAAIYEALLRKEAQMKGLL